MSDNIEKVELKKNTDALKLKQEEKKKKKEQENDGQGKKQKKKQKAKKKPQQLQKVEEPIKTSQVINKVYSSDRQSLRKQPIYRTLRKIDELLEKSEQCNRKYQLQLVYKYMDQLVVKSDLVLFLSSSQWNCPSEQISIQKFNLAEEAEIITRYSDVSYLMEGKITKIFVEAAYLFGDGSILAKKGSLNIVLLAAHYKVPVVATSGSWNYNPFQPITYENLKERFGERVDNYDWIESSTFDNTVLEIGNVQSKQINSQIVAIYRDFNLEKLN